MKLRMLALLTVFAILLQNQDNGLNAACSGCGRGSSLLSSATASSSITSGILDYAYIYNLTPGTVLIEADVTFDTNGILTSGFIHAPSTAAIVVVNAGIYKVDFSVSPSDPSQFALFLNGVVVPGTVYGSGAGSQQNTGQAIFAIPAGSILTLRNHSSTPGTVSLEANQGGGQVNVNASITILKLSPIT